MDNRKSAVGRASRVRQSTSSMTSSRSSRQSSHRSSRFGQGSRRTHAQSDVSASHAVVIRDDDGNDVTPVSLLSAAPKPAPIQTGGDASESSGVHSPQSERSDEAMSVGMSVADESGATTPIGQGDNMDEAAEDAAEERPKELPFEEVVAPTAEEIEGRTTITLSETDTIWILDIEAERVGDEYPEVTEVKEQNEAYETRRKAQAGSDKFMPRSTQTINPLLKSKGVHAPPPTLADSGCQADVAAIADDVEKKDPIKKTSNSAGEKAGQSTNSESVLDHPNMMSTIRMVERLVTQNIYHDKHVRYRGTGDSPTEKGVSHLWTFKALDGSGAANAVAPNPQKPDVIAVGIGHRGFKNVGEGGAIHLWSVKNPEHPEQSVVMPSGVTTLAWSKRSPQLLAAGLHDGSVCVIDVSKPEVQPLRSTYTGGKHGDAVWEVDWVDRGSERGESLVSVSADGRVTQWSVKKGLEFVDLMKLKRVSGKAGADAFISRAAAGTCLNFWQDDHNVYLVGTEDGTIHKCSCSYSEQYLDTFTGHSGPVYRVRWSPFDSSVFATASADWTMRVWSSHHHEPKVSAQPATEAVLDVAWSPRCSTVMASAGADGRLSVWDLSTSLLDPIASVAVETMPTSVIFGPSPHTLLVADANGAVHVYRLDGIENVSGGTEEQKRRLEVALAGKDGDNSTE